MIPIEDSRIAGRRWTAVEEDFQASKGLAAAFDP
jgi:hypothetical protein